jgi:uncharacterized protein YecE (DUF72 family)
MHRQFGHIRVGLSGWLYPGWRGVFCPKGLRHKDELAYASRRVDTIEINGTFYSLQRPELFAGWREATPDGFVFAVKGGRFITHMKRLRNIDTALANFVASGVLALHDKLGPFLRTRRSTAGRHGAGAGPMAVSPVDAKLIDAATAPRAEPRDVYVYFDNDAKVRAPIDAEALRKRLS